VLALLLAAVLAQVPRGEAQLPAPGLVVFVGKGATIDAATAAELGGENRVLLAAGDPAQAVDPLESAGAPAARVVLDAARPYVGDDRETAERIRGSRCIVIAGGDYFDWFGVATPGGTTTRLSDSIRAAHRGGATVVGAGSAAPYLAKWAMVERSALAKPERNPRRRRADVAIEGLGLLPDLLVDTSACERGSPARLLRAAFDGHLDRALYLDGPVVWIADPSRKTARVMGAGTALDFHLAAARRQRGTWQGARLALLRAGDLWSEREGPRRADGAAAVRLDADPSLDLVRRSLEGAKARIVLRADERTAADGASGIAFDLEWEPSGS